MTTIIHQGRKLAQFPSMRTQNQTSNCQYQLETTQIDGTITSIIDCIAYWNRTVKTPPKTSYKTEFETNLDSMNTSTFRAYLLDMLFCDCKVLTGDAPYICGQSGSHIGS